MSNNIEKIIKLFENIKSNLKNIDISLIKGIDYKGINDFINEFENNIYSLNEISKYKSALKLNDEEEKELNGLLKIIDAFNNNDALVLSKDIEIEIRSKKVIKNLLTKLKGLLKDYKAYLKTVKEYENEVLKIDDIIKGLKNKTDVDYIENIDEIYDYLYSKNNIDLKIKFEIYRLIGEYNILVGKNKMDILTKGSSQKVKEQPKKKIEKTEEKVEKPEIIVEKTSNNDVHESLKLVLSKYGYNIDKIDKQIVDRLEKSDLDIIESVLSFFKSIDLKFNESLKSSEKYLVMLYRSDRQTLENVKKICEENGIEITCLIKKCPTTTMKKTTSLKSGKPSATVDPEYQMFYPGAYEDFLANIETLKELGYDINKAMNECITILSYPNKNLLENIKALEIYGISVKDSNGTFKLSGLKNKDVLFTIDQFIELEELPYVTYNTSRFALAPDDAIFYRLYKIKKYNSVNPLNPIEYRRYKDKGYDFTSMITQDKKGNEIVDRSKDKHKETNTIIPKVFDEETTIRLKYLIEKNKSYFKKNNKNVDLVKYLDLRFKSPKSESTYIIGGKVFSRIKVMRLFSILENEELDKNDLMVFSLTYNSIISEEEYERVKTAIYGKERGLKNE